MKVHNSNIYMTRGDTECIKVSQWTKKESNSEIKMSDSDYVFEPFSDGDVVELTVRKEVYSKNIIFHKKETQVADNGCFYIKILPEDTNGIEFGRYTYDIQATYANGDVKTIITPHIFEIGGECTWQNQD